MTGRPPNEALIYFPRSEGDQVAMARRIAARVLAVSAVIPYAFTQRRLASELDVNVGKMSLCVSELRDNAWINTRHQIVSQNQTGSALGATPQFWHDRRIAEAASTRIPSSHIHIYEDALRAFSADYQRAADQPDDPDLLSRAHWFGGAAILGDMHDLGESGTWLPGAAGWEALIRTSVSPQVTG